MIGEGEMTGVTPVNGTVLSGGGATDTKHAACTTTFPSDSPSRAAFAPFDGRRRLGTTCRVLRPTTVHHSPLFFPPMETQVLRTTAASLSPRCRGT